MGLTRAKDGNPSTRFYENPEIIATFDPVRIWLTRNHKKYTQTEPPTNKSLATLCFQLLQFQEANFTSTSRTFMKVPFKCFMDFKPGGGLCHIFLTCLKFRHENNWKKIDLTSSSRTEKHLEMFSVIERELIAYKCMEKPVVYISPLVEKTLNSKLRESAKRLNVSVVESPSEATHILHQPPPNWPGDSRDDFLVQRFRVLFHEGRGVLLHWLYSPASYTTWYTGLQSEWSTDTETSYLENENQWDIDARWLLYSDEMYEWMVEEDFLIPTSSVKPRLTYSRKLLMINHFYFIIIFLTNF
ncbi:SWI/SNF-related matrix-associated actin-dependent regulator of chromatin subfamily C member 1(smarcc1) [Schistosoma mansoni]|uniref:SWI/SNF-related matrix-associated actin-dependent regulator of chromatin subfamily C member 1(smarcc1) n=1 Tax=Schistosoma mansoni TaxID=6183 RepID=UPI00022C86F0|nr:SWI/SNF-related matrix-associated actin-dependent regulator of chromatin subfamily C member 1(smarcc1) [Schistosoma mansoni]|eukprot:XP_018646258.1 SWI/SNF-related matrix-associated actin-dependent regulator of chromatin subfamily C member 1(smarcc1) [Schistosoma mansoni]